MALCWRWLLNTHTSHIEFTCFYNYQSSALQVAAFPLNPTTAILLCFRFLVRLILWLFTRSLVSTAEINLLNHNVKSTHKKHELMKAEEASRQSDVTRLDFLFNETSRAPTSRLGRALCALFLCSEQSPESLSSTCGKSIGFPKFVLERHFMISLMKLWFCDCAHIVSIWPTRKSYKNDGQGGRGVGDCDVSLWNGKKLTVCSKIFTCWNHLGVTE